MLGFLYVNLSCKNICFTILFIDKKRQFVLILLICPLSLFLPNDTMRKLVFVFFVLSTFALSAQDINTKEILAQYQIKLDLTTEQTSNFGSILEKFNIELYKKDIANNTFNKSNKIRDLEIYKLLNAIQFEAYKKVKLDIEPTLKFRFN